MACYITSLTFSLLPSTQIVSYVQFSAFTLNLSLCSSQPDHNFWQLLIWNNNFSINKNLSVVLLSFQKQSINHFSWHSKSHLVITSLSYAYIHLANLPDYIFFRSINHFCFCSEDRKHRNIWTFFAIPHFSEFIFITEIVTANLK
jgi:hypothetical protein